MLIGAINAYEHLHFIPQNMLTELLTLAGIISLLTLVLMEVVLGIDNIVFIAIVSDRLEKTDQKKARSVGLTLALLIRIALLFGITWLIGLKEPFITIKDFGFSGKDLILLSGGLFLLYKSTLEIHAKVEGREEKISVGKDGKMKLSNAIAQIVMLDVIFSFDSILTAVGMVENNVLIMVVAVVISMCIMLAFSGNVSDFINRHPTVKMLALSFLLMIGMMLTAEAMHFHVPKGYIYFAMSFSLLVEMLNMRSRNSAHKKQE